MYIVATVSCGHNLLSCGHNLVNCNHNLNKELRMSPICHRSRATVSYSSASVLFHLFQYQHKSNITETDIYTNVL